MGQMWSDVSDVSDMSNSGANKYDFFMKVDAS